MSVDEKSYAIARLQEILLYLTSYSAQGKSSKVVGQ